MFAITVSDRDAATFIIPEILLLGKDQTIEAVIAGLEQYPSFVEHSNVAKAVDEALHADEEDIDHTQLGNTLLQIAVANPLTVPLQREFLTKREGLLTLSRHMLTKRE
jgi:hypothetical protein